MAITPKQYHPIVDMMGDEELQRFLDNIKNNVKKKVTNWPDVNDFIRHYCQTNIVR
jgi:tryptophan halogenase